jgi:hypothetical protein
LSFESNVYNKLDSTYKMLSDKIIREKALTEEIEEEIKKLLNETL